MSGGASQLEKTKSSAFAPDVHVNVLVNVNVPQNGIAFLQNQIKIS
jgi:hypothetical protein